MAGDGALACQVDFKAAGLSCSTTTAGSWFQSPTVLAANDVKASGREVRVSGHRQTNRRKGKQKDISREAQLLRRGLNKIVE